MSHLYNGIIAVIIVLLAAVLFISISVMRRQQNHKRDQTFSAVNVKHPIRKNSVIFGYVLLPIVIALLAAICLYLFR